MLHARGIVSLAANHEELYMLSDECGSSSSWPLSDLHVHDAQDGTHLRSFAVSERARDLALLSTGGLIVSSWDILGCSLLTWTRPDVWTREHTCKPGIHLTEIAATASELVALTSDERILRFALP